jgi:hypothetical protein
MELEEQIPEREVVEGSNSPDKPDFIQGVQ